MLDCFIYTDIVIARFVILIFSSNAIFIYLIIVIQNIRPVTLSFIELQLFICVLPLLLMFLHFLYILKETSIVGQVILAVT
jgi:hypothetical protein